MFDPKACYANLQKECARYGYSATPITFEQMQTVLKSGVSTDELYNFASDVANDCMPFDDLVRYYHPSFDPSD